MKNYNKPDQSGLDWDAIREDYEKRATPEELVDPLASPVVPKRPQGRKSRAKQEGEHKNWKGATRMSLDKEKLVYLYTQEKTRLSELAEMFSCHPDTIRRNLIDLGVYDPNRDKGGTKRKDKCIYGHDMSDAIVLKGGGRQCRYCTRRRNRERWQRIKEQRAAQAAQEVQDGEEAV